MVGRGGQAKRATIVSSRRFLSRYNIRHCKWAVAPCRASLRRQRHFASKLVMSWRWATCEKLKVARCEDRCSVKRDEIKFSERKRERKREEEREGRKSVVAAISRIVECGIFHKSFLILFFPLSRIEFRRRRHRGYKGDTYSFRFSDSACRYDAINYRIIHANGSLARNWLPYLLSFSRSCCVTEVNVNLMRRLNDVRRSKRIERDVKQTKGHKA